MDTSVCSLDIVIATALRAPVETIRGTIRSVVANTHFPKSIILVINSQLDHEQSIAVVKNATGGLDADKAINVIYLEGERGFCRPNNVGISCCESPFICLLNDDVLVPSDWDKGLIEKIVEHDAAMCCPLIAGAARNNGEDRHRDKKPGAYRSGIELCFSCAMFPAETFEVFGLLSMHPDLALLGNDTEYCQRLLSADAKIMLATDCVVEAPRRTTVGPIMESMGTNEREVQKKATAAIKMFHPSF